MKNKLIFGACALIIIGIAGYNLLGRLPATPLTSTKITVTTSFYPLYFFTSEITKDRVDVYNITPAGAEPHDYEPTAQDMKRIEDSKLLIMNGGKLEPWGDNVKSLLSGSKTAVVSVGESVATEELVEDGATIRDPHVWLSPKLAKIQVASILASVIVADPINANFYENNANTLLAKLDNLDQKYTMGLNNCQLSSIVTAHAAFGYLAREYSLLQVAISGLSPDTEPSAKELAEVTSYVKKNNIGYIFFETLVSPKLAETIARETGARTLVLNPLEGLSDQEISAGKNYFTEMENNLKNLQTALQCR